MTTLELNKEVKSIETIEDLKFQKDVIIETIKSEGGNINDVMTQMLNIVTASNWSFMCGNTDRDELVYMAIDDVNRECEIVDNSEMYAKAALNQRPSSMR